MKEKKKVVSKLENKDGVFTLLKNNSFEAVFKNGYKVNLKGNDNTVRLKTPDGNTLEMSPSSEESLSYSLEAKAIATKALKYYNALASEKPDMLGAVWNEISQRGTYQSMIHQQKGFSFFINFSYYFFCLENIKNAKKIIIKSL